MLNTKKIYIPKRLVFVLSFVIPFITVIVGFIAGGFAPFGSKDLMTAGGYDKIIPFFQEFYDRVHTGSVFQYSTKTGLGYDFTTVLTYYISDPTNFLILIFPKSAMLAVLNLLFAVKVGIAGLFTTFFFSYRSKIRNKDFNAFITLSLSVAYALSSYMMSYGINLSYTSAIAIFPLIILGIDKIVNEKKWVIYAVSMTLSIYFNLYISLIIFVFSIVYLFILEYKDTAHCITTLTYKLIADLLAFLTSFVIIYNSVTSSFFKNDINLGFYGQGMYSNIWNTIKMGLTRSLPYQLASESYGVNLFVGTLAILVIFPFLLNNGLKLSYRIKNLLLLGLLIISCFSITSNYFFNLFFLNLEDKVFFGFIICFLLISICYDTLENIDHVRQRYIAISFLLSASIVVLSMLFCTSYDSISPFITTLEFLLFYMLIILIYKQKNISGDIFHILICLLLIFELVSNSFISINSLGKNSVAYENSNTNTIEREIDYIHTIEPDARVFVYDNIESTSTPMSYLINGYDYIIITQGIDVDPYLQFQDSLNGYDIYKNPYSFSNGVSVNADPTGYVYNPSYPYTSNNILADEIFNSEPIFETISGNVQRRHLVTGESVLVYSVDEAGDIYSNLAKRTFHFKVSSTDEAYIIPNEDSLLTRRERVFTGEITKLDSSKLDSLYNRYKNANAYSSSNNTAYRIIPISDYTKWNTDIGSISSVNIAGDDLVCLKTDNSSNFSLIFSPNNLYIGAIISLISLIVFIAIILITKKSNSTETTDDKIIQIIDHHKDPILIFIICSIGFIAILMYTCCIPFGQKSFATSDGLVQAYPLSTYLYNKFGDKNLSLINYQIGFGIDNYLLFYTSLISPLNLLRIIFGIKQNLFINNFDFYIRFILCAEFFYLFITKRPHSKNYPPKRIIVYISIIAYAFSTYFIAYFPIMQAIMYFTPLVFLVTEKLLYEKKILPYVFVMSYIMAYMNYGAFLICEFLFLFFFISNFEGIKDFFMKGFRFALSSILAAGIAAFGLIPFYLFTQQSPYTTADSAANFIFDQTILKSLYDFQFLHVVEPVTNDDFRANTYCGLLLLLVLALYICIKNIKLSVRLRTIALILLLYFSYGNSLMNFILHGFHKQVMVPNRFSIFFIVLLILIFIDVIENIDTLNTKKSIISLSVWFFILLSGFIILNKSNYDLSSISTIILLTLYLILLVLYIAKKKSIIVKLLAYLTIAEVLINAYLISYISIGQIASFADSTMDQTKKLAKEYNLGDNKLVRTEQLNYVLINGSCMTDVNSITYFSSITTKYQSSLSHYFNVRTGTNSIQYDQGNPLANLMYSVKYFITSEYNDYVELPSYYKTLTREGDVTLYENELSLDPGILIPGNGDYIPYDSIEDDSLEYQNNITNKLISKDIYRILDRTKGEVSIEYDAEESVNGLTNVNITVSEDIEGYTYLSYNTVIYYLGMSTSGSIDEFDMDLGELFDTTDIEFNSLSVGVLDIDNLTELHDYLAKDTMTDFQYGFNTITGNIDASTNGTIYLTIPAYPTWEVYVDGVKTEWIKFMGGLGIPITAGNHSIKLIYHTLGLKEGFIISGVSIFILLIYIIISKKKHSKAEKG